MEKNPNNWRDFMGELMKWRTALFLALMVAVIIAPIIYAVLARTSTPWPLTLLISWIILIAAVVGLAFSSPGS